MDEAFCAPGTWATSNTGPGERYRAGSATNGSFIYVFGGGAAGGGFLNDVWRWNPATETWTALANMPTARQNVQGAYWNGKIYVPGGFITGSVHTTENAIYDVASNTWSTGAPLPAAQSGQAVAYNNKIYVFAGNPGPMTTTRIYDIAANTWSTGAPMPVPITYGRAIVVGNYAYYIGGIQGGTTVVNTVYRYDFAADSWMTMAPLQTARTSAEVMSPPGSNKIFAVGGGSTSGFFTAVSQAESVEVYDVATNSWSYGNPLVTKVAAAAGGWAAGKLLAQGGIDITNYYNTAQVAAATACGSCGSAVWGSAATGPAERYRAGSAVDGTYVYVFGGGTPTGGFLNDLWRWNPATETWTQLANMPTPRQNVQGAYWNGRIYVPGGFTTGSVHTTENAIYNIATNSWSTGAPLPAAQTGQAVAYNNKIYLFAGNPGPVATTRIYDIATNTWTTGAPMPVGITYGRAIVVGNYAYYIGGIINGTTNVNTVYRYDFAGNSWATMTPMQTPRGSAEVMSPPGSNKIFAVGGGGSSFFTAVPQPESVEVYDVASNSWYYGSPLATKVAAPAGGFAGGKLMVQGGVDSAAYYNSVQRAAAACAPTVISAVSRKSHSGAGNFDIALPLTGDPGIECRQGLGPTSDSHQIIVTFAAPVTSTGVTVQSSNGLATASTSTAGAVVTITLNAVANAQRLRVTLHAVNDGTTAGDVVIPVAFLLGDTTPNGSVTASDIGQVKSVSGATANPSNFRSDVTPNGTITASDLGLVKSRAGTVLPPP